MKVRSRRVFERESEAESFISPLITGPDVRDGFNVTSVCDEYVTQVLQDLCFCHDSLFRRVVRL